MRVVITGGAGFLGSHLCEQLLAAGHQVCCVDSLITGRLENLAAFENHPGFTFLRHDVTKPIEVEGAVDAVMHFASPASPVDYLRLPIQTLKVGSLGTHNALGLAKARGARFLLASTSEVYGDPEVSPQAEDYWGHVNPVGPRGVYDEAKRFAEALTLAYHRITSWIRASPASSIPMALGCGLTTAASSPISSSRLCKVKTSRFMETGLRPAAFATSRTSWKEFSGCSFTTPQRQKLRLPARRTFTCLSTWETPPKLASLKSPR